jgi:hypothetical protein
VNDTAIAILIALIFTVLIVTIEVASQSKGSLKACFSAAFFLYFAILAVGNSVTTLLASVIAAGRLPNALITWFPFFYAFFGVFAFEGVLGNTNLTIFDRGVLTIQDWISKARDPAIAKAISNNVRLNTNSANKAAQGLRQKLKEPELNTYIDQKFGPGTAAKLDDDANKSNSDRVLYKALEFAIKAPVETQAILKP